MKPGEARENSTTIAQDILGNKGDFMIRNRAKSFNVVDDGCNVCVVRQLWVVRVLRRSRHLERS